MPVVQIIAGHAVELYPDGVTRTIYDDKEFYEVKPHIAESMIARGWAQILSPTSSQAKEETQPRQPPEPESGSRKRR